MYVHVLVANACSRDYAQTKTADGLEQSTKRRKAGNVSDPPMFAATATSVAFSNKLGDLGYVAEGTSSGNSAQAHNFRN